MNPKILGQSIRRGVVVGAVTGLLAGAGAFAANGRPQPAAPAMHPALEPAASVWSDVPPVPALPTLRPIPTVIGVQAAKQTNIAAPPPLPTLQPIPPLPPVSVAVHTTTRTS